jgi:hypothetical protein
VRLSNLLKPCTKRGFALSSAAARRVRHMGDPERDIHFFPSDSLSLSLSLLHGYNKIQVTFWRPQHFYIIALRTGRSAVLPGNKYANLYIKKY